MRNIIMVREIFYYIRKILIACIEKEKNLYYIMKKIIYYE